MSAGKFKLNPDKTEFILFGSKKQRERLNVCFLIDILGNPLQTTESVRNLGVWFDSDFSFSKQVQNVCKNCFIQLRDFRNIIQFLTQDAAVSLPMLLLVVGWTTVTHFLGVSANSIFIDYKTAARIVTNSSKYVQITPLATLVYKFIHTGFPKYFAPYLSTYHTTYNTRCSQSVANFLNVPKFQPT